MGKKEEREEGRKERIEIKDALSKRILTDVPKKL